MSTQKGDKYHSKWNFDYSLQEVKKWLAYAQEDDNCYFFGTVLAHFNLWDDLAARLMSKHEDTEISRTIKIIKELIKQRLFSAGLQKKVDAAVCIFGLKNMGMSDKKDIAIQVEPITLEIIFAKDEKK